MPHITEYLVTVCYRMLEYSGGSWNVEQPGSELQLINLGEPAQPQYSWCLWHDTSSSSLLLTCFACLCTELLLVFKVDELGLCHSKAAKLYLHLMNSGSSVASVPCHTRACCQHLGGMLHLLILSQDYQRNT